MDPIKPEAMDDLYTRGSTRLARITLWNCRARGEARTLAAHQGKFYDSEDLVEATFDGVVFTSWSLERGNLELAGAEYCILRAPQELSHNQIVLGQAALIESKGWRYSRAELGLCFLDGLLEKAVGRQVILFRRFDLFRERVICSKTANRADIKACILPREAYYFNPDDTYDYKTKILGWKIAYCTSNWLTPP